MLTLKLILVPLFLLLVTLASRRWGPAVAGWLGGLPVVAGPILYFIAVEQGAAYAAGSATAALSGVFAAIVFSVGYTRTALHRPWPVAAAVALGAWALAALGLAQLPQQPALALGVALLALLAAPRLFPAVRAPSGAHAVSTFEIGCRMLAGALLTLAATGAAQHAGPAWGGLLAVFPVLSVVLAAFSQRAHGAAYTTVLLSSMARGLYSFAAFCLALALALPRLGTAASFALAVALALALHAAARRRLRPAAPALEADERAC